MDRHREGRRGRERLLALAILGRTRDRDAIVLWKPGRQLEVVSAVKKILNPFGCDLASPAMMKNVGRLDRAGRGLLAFALLLGAWFAPLSMLPRVAIAATGTYLALSMLFGTCLGYRMMGLSTCPRTTR